MAVKDTKQADLKKLGKMNLSYASGNAVTGGSKGSPEDPIQADLKAQSMQNLLLGLWAGEDRVFDPRRNADIRKVAEGIIYCSSHARPKNPGKDQKIWDQHYVARKLKLETFFYPKECMEIFVEAGENRTFESKGKSLRNRRDPYICANIVRVRRHLQPNIHNLDNDGERKKPLMDCTLEIPVEIAHLSPDRWQKINRNLSDHGVPEHLLPCPRNMSEFHQNDHPHSWQRISHTVHTKISNMSIAARGHHPGGVVPQEKGTYATLKSGRHPDAVMGLRYEDAKHFYASGAGKRLQPAIDTAAKYSSYLNHMCGISHIENIDQKRMKPDGTAPQFYDEEHFGKIYFFLNAAGTSKSKKRHGGILDEYRKVLNRTQSRAGLKKIAAMLHPLRSMLPSSAEKDAIGSRSIIEEDFKYRTRNIKDFSKVTPDEVADAVFYGGATEKGDVVNYGPCSTADAMLSATCIGTIDGSAVRATHTGEKALTHLRDLVQTRIAEDARSGRSSSLRS